MTDLSIGQVARRARIATSAIRYYERVGLLPEPHRVSGARRYDERTLDRLAIIAAAKALGFTLEETKTLVRGIEDETDHVERLRMLAQNKLAEVEATLARAKAVRRVLLDATQCRCTNTARCIEALHAAANGAIR